MSAAQSRDQEVRDTLYSTWRGTDIYLDAIIILFERGPIRWRSL